MKKIGLIANMKKDNIKAAVPEIISLLNHRGAEVLMPSGTADNLNSINSDMSVNEMLNLVQCFIVLGGDGTILSSARMGARAGIPVLGINMGRLGFLSELDIPDVANGFDSLFREDFYIDERMMLYARVIRDSRVLEEFTCLNDAVITKGAFARLIMLETRVNGEEVGTYPADGIIVASPTGSTAYSLSAGGPVVTPNLDLMLITPICPHALWARPMVISPSSKVEVKVLSDRAEIMLTVDGQHGLRLEQNDIVYIGSSSLKAKFLRLKQRSFFNVLRKKLSEGQRENG